MAQPDPYRSPMPSNQKSWEKKSPAPVGEEFSAREVTDVFRTIAAHGGGTASFDLALDLVLNEVVEQARLATGATGAAIALERAGEMVCRASSGADAPELGVRLDLTSGLSGVCLQTGTIQRCSDTETDPRVNAEDCRRLGLRSMVMLPLEGGAAGGVGRFGILQAFSSWPNAFSDRDVNTLQVLARRVVENVAENQAQAQAAAVAPAVPSAVANVVPRAEQGVAAPAANPTKSLDGSLRANERLGSIAAAVTSPDRALTDDGGRSPSEMSSVETPSMNSAGSSAWTSVGTSVLGLLVIVLAVVLGLAMGWRAGLGRGAHSPQTMSALTADRDRDSAPDKTVAAVPGTSTAADTSASPAKGSSGTSAVEPPSGGLLVTENGHVIYRLPAGGSAIGTGATSRKSESPATRLIHRVEPEYPAEASAKNIQGAVTLEVEIGTDGAVHNITVVDGEAQLAEAAVQAVRQWRYQPYRVNGRAVEMETRVTIRFTRPAS